MAKIETSLTFFDVMELFQQLTDEVEKLLVDNQKVLFEKVGLENFELDVEQKNGSFFFELKTTKKPSKRFVKTFDEKLVFITELADDDYEEIDGEIKINKELETKIASLYEMIINAFGIFEIKFCLGDCANVVNQNEKGVENGKMGS